MALNVFKIKKWGALIFNSLFTTICFWIALKFYGFWIALVVMLAAMLVSMLVSNLMLKTPFRMMEEGKGILVMNWDSSGIIRLTLANLFSPFIKGKLGIKNIVDVWDRSTVAQLAAPILNSKPVEVIKEGKKRGGIKLELDEQQYNESRFVLFHYPVLIWNDQIESLITKDFLAEKEKGTFAEHGVLFLNRRVEDLTNLIRDFARHVVETSRKKTSFFQSKWVWIIMIIAFVIIAAMFAPSLIKTITGAMGAAGGAVDSAVGGSSPITPR